MPFFSSETTQKDIDECAKAAEEKGHSVVLLLNDVAPETVKKIPKGIDTVQFYSSIPKVILGLLALPELQHVKSLGIIGGATADVIDALPARFRIQNITIHGGDDKCRPKDVIAALERRNGPAPLALRQSRQLLGPKHNSGNNHRNHNATRTAPDQFSQLHPNRYTPPTPTIFMPGSQVFTAPLPGSVTRMMFWRVGPGVSHQFFTAQPSPLSAQAPHQFFSAQPSALSSTASRPFFTAPARASSTSAPYQSFAAQPSALSVVAQEITVKKEDKKQAFSFEEKTPAEIAAACHLLHLDPDNISDSTERTDESTDMETDRPAFTAGRSAVS